MSINRSNVNSPSVHAQDFPKSGFDLSYKSRMDFVLGRLIPSGFQWIMPADKFQGSDDVKHTFNRLVVPEISDVEVSQHAFFVPLRAIDSSFIKGIVPTELLKSNRLKRLSVQNNPNIISTKARKEKDGTRQEDDMPFSSVVLRDEIADFKQDCPDKESIIDYLKSTLGVESQKLKKYYLDDFLDDYLDYTATLLNTLSAEIGTDTLQYYRNTVYILLDAYLTPLFGENSLFDLLGYNYLRRSDMYNICQFLSADGFDYRDDLLPYINNDLQSEYAIRAYYAIWYEHYRDKFLEKRSDSLPDWRDFGSTPLLSGSDFMCFIIPRYRSWAKDMYVGSMPDDISRHVFAPIVSKTDNVHILADDYQYLNAENTLSNSGEKSLVNMTSYELEYLDPVSGSRRIVSCPVPKAVNDFVSNADAATQTLNAYYLDLRDLRKSQMLERYLKRNFYFGDEYEDRMLAHYGSKVSDNSIKRPHLLSSSVSNVNPIQEVASVGTDSTPAGTRTATVQDSANSSAYEFFSEEFGIVINMLSLVPRAQYAPTCPQNFISCVTDFPLPEFANNNDEFGRVREIAATGIANPDDSVNYGIYQFGHFPYAHAWRSRVDEVHGSFLSDKQAYTFRRYFGMNNADNVPKLNYRFIHCRPNLDMFADTVRLSGQGYLTADHHFYVERVLPTPVEEI